MFAIALNYDKHILVQFLKTRLVMITKYTKYTKYIKIWIFSYVPLR